MFVSSRIRTCVYDLQEQLRVHRAHQLHYRNMLTTSSTSDNDNMLRRWRMATPRQSDHNSVRSPPDAVASITQCFRKHKRKPRKKYRPGSDTPPSYAVIEDSNGHLISNSLDVVWPERPEKGRYSLDEYKKRKDHEEELRKRDDQLRSRRPRRRRRKRTDQRDGSSRWSSESDSDVPSEGDHISENGRPHKPSASPFVGVLPPSLMRRSLKPNHFRLYYERPEAITTFSEVPLKMPLKLAYMSLSGKLYQFGFNVANSRRGSKTWQLDCGGFSGQAQPRFKSLRTLITYYESYVLGSQDKESPPKFPVVNSRDERRRSTN